MPRKTKDEAEQTRIGIMQAALTVFNDKGVSCSSLADIAKEAGVTRGAIYWHFENKSDLMHQIMSYYFEGIDERIHDQHAALKGEAFILQASQSWLDVIESDENFQKLLEITFFKMEHSGDMSVLQEVFSSILQADISDFQKELQYSVDHGDFRSDVNLYEISLSFMATIQGSLMQWILFKKDYPLRSVITNSVNALLNSIRTQAK